MMKSDTALLVIDVQNGMFQEPYPVYDHENLLERLHGLILKARASQIPVIYVQHNENEGLVPNSPEWDIHPRIAPAEGEKRIQKWQPDAFQDTNLAAELEVLGVSKVVLTGLQTDLCVYATSRRAHALGYQVTVVKDGHSTWSQGNQSAPQIIAQFNDQFQSFGKIIESQLLRFC